MSRRIVALLACLVLAAPALAQRDRGKDLLPKLMAGPTAAAAASTVRVLSDNRDAALGTVVSADGLVLTKGSELRGELAVKLRTGEVYDAKLVGYHRPTDLALIKVDTTGLTPVAFATAPGAVGGWVAAPGLGAEPAAVGVLSAAARKIDPRSPEGQLVENMNKGYLGINFGERNDEVVVTDINPHSKAYGRLKEKDVLVEVAGQPVPNRDALIERLDAYKPGDTVALKLRRGEEELTVKVTLVPRSVIDRGAFQNTLGNNQLSGRRAGFPAVLQHDAAVRPADCGGPLVDLDGRVLGINIARAGRVETLALPTDVVNEVLPGLKEGKYKPVGK
jgi:serine protease Do